MDKITGRSDDMMILRGVNVFPSQIEEEEILKLAHNIKSYIGVTSIIELRNVGGVARSEGKAVRIIDKRSR